MRAMTSSTSAAISIRDLKKRYAPAGNGEGKLALKGVSFDVPEGGIFGLLGPNGAGKSTLINIMAGLVRKSSGTIDIWGFDIDKHQRNAKRSIGIVPQEIVFDPFFTVRETLRLQSGYFGIRNNDGIMHMMVIDIVEQLFAQGRARYLMYDTFFGAQPGLQTFKKILGFRPYRARYTLQ